MIFFLPFLILLWTCSYLCLQQFLNAKHRGTTGNGNDVNMLTTSTLKSLWNHIKWTYFWQVLAVWNHCVLQARYIQKIALALKPIIKTHKKHKQPVQTKKKKWSSWKHVQQITKGLFCFLPYYFYHTYSLWLWWYNNFKKKPLEFIRCQELLKKTQQLSRQNKT